MCERGIGKERHHSRTGVFKDMRSIRVNQPTDPLDLYVDHQSAAQISHDVRKRVHKWNINYWGVVTGEDVPDMSEARSCANCKDESYRNIFLYQGEGNNGMRNVNWYILPPATIHE